TADVLDATSGVVLDSQNVSSFGNGRYLVWNVSGHVTVRLTRNASNNAVIGGLFFDPSSGSTTNPPPVTSNTPPVVSLTANSTSFIAPANVTLTANATDSNGIAKVEFFQASTK